MVKAWTSSPHPSPYSFIPQGHQAPLRPCHPCVSPGAALLGGVVLDTHGSEAVPVGRRLGWGSSHYCLCSAKCAHRLPAKRGLCCLPVAYWLT